MKLTKKDHEARVARLADGTSPDPDDDRRLVKLYESQRRSVEQEDPQPVDEPVEEEQPKPRGRRRSL